MKNKAVRAEKEIESFLSMFEGLAAYKEDLKEAGSRERLIGNLENKIKGLGEKEQEAQRLLQSLEATHQSRVAEQEQELSALRAKIAEESKQIGVAETEAASIVDTAKAKAEAILQEATHKAKESIEAGRLAGAKAVSSVAGEVERARASLQDLEKARGEAKADRDAAVRERMEAEAVLAQLKSDIDALRKKYAA